MDLEKIKNEMEEAKKAITDAKLPDEMQKIAFSKIMDKILELDNSNKSNKKNSKKSNRKKRDFNKTTKKDDLADEIEEEKDKIVGELSRSKHEIIYKLTTSLDQSLYILKIAEEEFSIDSLTPTQISKILREVFKIKRTSQAISMALMTSVSFVDRKKIVVHGSPAYKYSLVHKGEEQINNKTKEVEASKEETTEEEAIEENHTQ